MAEELRVKYLFVNLRYRNYVRLQAGIVVTWIVLAVIAYVARSGSPSPLWSNAWLVGVIAAVAEGVESKLAVDKAKAAAAGS